MTEPNAKVICHTKAPNGEELITLEIELHRFILPEQNTHRVFSRNYQSSRAIPVLRQLEQIANDPAMPVFWGKNQAGMVAKEEVSGVDRELAEMIILGMRDACLNGVKQLQKLNLHKQIANRYVEPWMWTKGVVTATLKDFEGFFLLRLHEDAQPEIKVLATAIYEAMEGGVPTSLQYGEYHLPYVQMQYPDTGQTSLNNESVEDVIKISASSCGQVSYRALDTSLEKALKIYDMLNLPENGVYKEAPPHFSPTEHIAKIADPSQFKEGCNGNFNSVVFWQYRKALEGGNEREFML